jgi:hypothetical protein
MDASSLSQPIASLFHVFNLFCNIENAKDKHLLVERNPEFALRFSSVCLTFSLK